MTSSLRSDLAFGKNLAGGTEARWQQAEETSGSAGVQACLKRLVFKNQGWDFFFFNQIEIVMVSV